MGLDGCGLVKLFCERKKGKVSFLNRTFIAVGFLVLFF